MAELLNDGNFEEKISTGIVLCYFGASWCAPCKVISPLVDEISEERDDAMVYKMNIEDSLEAPVKFAIRSIPTLIVFRDGKVFDKIVGSANKEQLNNLINAAL
jgi:thioredoxin 1